MSKLSKDKRDMLILICIMSIGITTALYYLVIYDQRDELSTLAGKIATIEDKTRRSASMIKRQKDAEEQREAARKILIAKQELMPQPGEGPRWFHVLMEERRRDFNLDMPNVTNPEQPISAGVLPKFAFTGVGFTVTMAGTYTDFGKFLADFENRYPYMRVQLESIAPETVTQFGSATSASGGASRPGANSETEQVRLRFIFRVISLIKTQV